MVSLELDLDIVTVKDIMFNLQSLMKDWKITHNTKVCMNMNPWKSVELTPIRYTPSVVPKKYGDYKDWLCIN